jgi:RNA polymerase sigma-70 factor, ECF subfamily
VASFVEGHGQAGDEGNFEVLYRTYKTEVQRLASYLLRNAGEAEDASQTVFLNVLRALRQGVRPTDPRAWLLAITRNVCFSRRRAVACRPDEVELDPETVGDSGDGGGPSADDIVGALARLLPNQRTALILRDFRGVPRAEISELLAVSPTGVEALLSRARASFREELEADAQPFACAETRALVEQQLEGVITVAERHSLRAHLRHCSPCSTLARAVRSSSGKLASLILWPAELISRLASALSQAPTAVHVAAAISSAAVVAGVAIPVAILHDPASAHVEGRAAPGLSVIVHPMSSSLTQLRSTVRLGSRTPIRTALAHKPSAHTHVRARAPARSHPLRTAAPTAAAAAAPPTGTSDRTAAPVAVSSHPAFPQASTVSHPFATPPRSISPAARPTTKPKPKPARRAPKRRGNGRHGPLPPDKMPASTPPAGTLPPPTDGATDGAGPGFSSGSPSTSAAVPAAQNANAGAGSSGDNTSSSDNNSSNNSGKGHHKHR